VGLRARGARGSWGSGLVGLGALRRRPRRRFSRRLRFRLRLSLSRWLRFRVHLGAWRLGARGVRDSRLVWCMVQGSSSSRFKARVVHGSRLVGVHVGLRARRHGTRGSWGFGLVELGDRGVRCSRLAWCMAH
jgi:hypothetical protein